MYDDPTPTKASDHPISHKEAKKQNIFKYGNRAITRQEVSSVLKEYASSDKSMVTICTNLKVPYDLVWDIACNNKEFKPIIERARAMKAQVYAETSVEDANNDTRHPGHNNNSIKAKHFMASAYDKDTYGNKISLSHSVEPVTIGVPDPGQAIRDRQNQLPGSNEQ